MPFVGAQLRCAIGACNIHITNRPAQLSSHKPRPTALNLPSVPHPRAIATYHVGAQLRCAISTCNNQLAALNGLDPISYPAGSELSSGFPMTKVVFRPSAINVRLVHSLNKPHHLMSSAKTPSANDEIQLRLLRLLEANPQMTQRDMAEALGVSLGKTNFCIKALFERGLIKLNNFQNNRHKLAYSYLLTPAGIVEKELQS